VYRAAIAALETRVAAAGGAMPLSGLHHQLAEFQGLLPPLHQLLHAVSAQRLTGAPLLHLLHTKVSSPGYRTGGFNWIPLGLWSPPGGSGWRAAAAHAAHRGVISGV
jgi:hypothetical protein